jgi:hypothetical protein
MLRFVAIGGAAAAYILLARPLLLTWGATDQESDDRLPGDDLIVHADLTATRAITIRAPADHVWPWIAQLGAGAGRVLQLRLPRKHVGLRHPQRGSDRV